MSTHKSIKDPLWIPLILLLHLVALLLPASAASASVQANPVPISAQDNASAQDDSCIAESLRSASQPAQAGPVDANQIVEIQQSTVDSAVQYANWQHKYRDVERVESLINTAFLVRIKSASSEAILNQFRSRYRARIGDDAELMRNGVSYDGVIYHMLDEALKIPDLAPLVPAVWRSIAEVSTEALFPDSSIKIAESMQRLTLTARLNQKAPQIIKQVIDCAARKPSVAKIFDAIHKGKLKSSIGDNAKKVIEQNPSLPMLKEIIERLGENGTINITLNELKQLSKDEFAKINASLDDMRITLDQIDAKQDVIIEYLQNQQEREQAQALAKQKAEEHQAKIDAAKSAVSIISALVSEIDPKLGKDLGVVGASVIQATEAVHGWLKAVAGLNGLDKVFSLSTVAMTGNVLGAIFNVIGLFGADQPSPEQMILEEIGKLRQQVDQLRTEMHDRFDRIDSGLNAIYTTMQERFNLIDIELGKINGKLDEIQESLLQLDTQLSRIEQNNFEFLSALSRRPLLEAINGGLNYEEVTGAQMPYEPQFVSFANTLHAWGTIHAFDALEAGPSQVDYSDDHLFTVLSAYQDDANINFFNGWLVAHGLPAITNKRLASPRDWLLTTRAYSQLGNEWPQHMARYSPQRQVELDKVGADIEAAMRAIATRQTTTGTVGNTLLFSTVISHYQDKLNRVLTPMQLEIEDKFVKEVVSQRLRQSVSFDLFGGVEQPAPVEAAIALNLCGTEATLEPPADLKTHIADFDRYSLAHYFWVGEFTGCASGSLLNPTKECSPQTEVCHTSGDLRVALNVYFENVLMLSQSVRAGRIVVEEEGDVPDYLINHWQEILAKFASSGRTATPSDEQLAERANLLAKKKAEIHAKLATYQQELYVRMQHELTQGSLRPAAIQLAGSKALLDGFTTLGLSRALRNDDFFNALLFGEQRLLDDIQIVHSYALSATQPITTMNITVNPRLVLADAAEERGKAFVEILTNYLDAITAGIHTEAPDYLVNLRRELELTVRIATFKPEPPPTPVPGQQQVFLPLVNR